MGRGFRLSNLLIPFGRETSQLDHVVVSMYGIFVIETKNYHGVVEGRENERYWDHHVGREHHQMFNPIMQNSGHIHALQALLGDDPHAANGSVYVNLVAFGGSVALDVQARSWVGYVDELPRTIERYQRIRLDGRQVRHAVEVLERENRKGLAERWGHARRVRRRK